MQGARPPITQGHVCVRAGTDNTLIVHGGWTDGLQPLSEVWLLHSRQTAWHAVIPVVQGMQDSLIYRMLIAAGTVPRARTWHSALWVPMLRGMLIFGGRDNEDTCMRDMHLFVLGAV